MKRLRTLSISNPAALDARNHKAAWGGFWWRNVNLRKRREAQARHARLAHRQLQAILSGAGSSPLDYRLPDDDAPPAPMVH